MLALQVDFNEREVLPDGSQAGGIFFGPSENPPALEQRMQSGLRVILYDSGDRYEGVLRRGTYVDWVADLVPGSARELAPGEYERLRTETLRAAEQIE
jgi:hypothetical protein